MSSLVGAEMAKVMADVAHLYGHLPDPTTLEPEEARKQSELTNAIWNDGSPAMSAVETVSIPSEGSLGTPSTFARVFHRDGAAGTVLYLHGGGWAVCSPATHDRAMRLLAHETGLSVVGLHYRLAPENPFPCGLHDAVAAFRALADAPFLSANERQLFAVSGDSAGANLALALLLHEQAEGRRIADHGLLFYGVYADGAETSSHRQYGDGRFGLSTAKMKRYWDWYVPASEMRNDPLAAPLRATDASLRSLPPLFLNVAERDPLADDTHLLVARLSALRAGDVLEFHEGVIHGFMQMSLQLPEAQRAFALAGAFSRRRTNTNPNI